MFSALRSISGGAEVAAILILACVGHAPVEVVKGTEALDGPMIEKAVQRYVFFVPPGDGVEDNPLVFIGNAHDRSPHPLIL